MLNLFLADAKSPSFFATPDSYRDVQIKKILFHTDYADFSRFILIIIYVNLLKSF